MVKRKEGASPPLSSKRKFKVLMRIREYWGQPQDAASDAHTWEPDVFLTRSKKSVLSPHSWLEVTSSYISLLGPSFVICERREPAEYAYLLPRYTLHHLVAVKQSCPACTPDKEFRSDSGCRIKKRLGNLSISIL